MTNLWRADYKALKVGSCNSVECFCAGFLAEVAGGASVLFPGSGITAGRADPVPPLYATTIHHNFHVTVSSSLQVRSTDPTASN